MQLPSVNQNLYTPIAIVVAGIIVAGALVGVNLAHSTGAAPAAAQGQTAPAAAVDIKNVKTAGEPYIGNANAPVTMAFWSDYQCPYCKAFEVGGVPQITTPAAMPDIMTNYVDTGKLKIVFKDFPFLGNDSITGAEYARAVWQLYPGQYFAFRTDMYVAQDEEGDQGFGNAATIDTLIKTKLPQIDDTKIKAAIAANKTAYDAAMNADESEGESMGISGTPGFIIGTQLIAGDEDYATFKAAIDAELAK
jgi:protein-disulfide isomerase